MPLRHEFYFPSLAEASSLRSWSIREEKGSSTRGVKALLKELLRAVGIPHQALLPHVMLIVEAS